jgi:hypothetical protein
MEMLNLRRMSFCKVQFTAAFFGDSQRRVYSVIRHSFCAPMFSVALFAVSGQSLTHLHRSVRNLRP